MEFDDRLNVLPLKKNEKKPIVKWDKYKKENYPRNLLANHTGNYGVVCGVTSNYLVILDFDFKNGCKNRFKQIILDLKELNPKLIKTRIDETPHGYHPYYFVPELPLRRKIVSNAINKDKFTGVVKTKYAKHLKGIDVLGQGGYSVIPPSKIGDKEYKVFRNHPIATLTVEEWYQLSEFCFLEKPIKMRKPFKDLVLGKTEIEGLTTDTGKNELVYWKFMFIEAKTRCKLEPSELYPFLEKNQPAFSREKVEAQFNSASHDIDAKPMTNETMEEYFPDFKAYKKEGFRTEKKERKPLEVVTKKREPLTKLEKDEAEMWLKSDENNRYKDITTSFKHDIVGKKELNNAQLIFFLKLGDQFSKDLMNRIHVHGDPSAGKSYVSDKVIKILPEENILIIDGGSNKIFRYLSDEDKDFCTIYLREMKKNMDFIEDLKTLGDNDSVFQYVDPQLLETITVNQNKAGQLTTYSFEYTQRDLSDRTWIMIPDQSYEQNERIKKFRLKCRREKIERFILEKRVKKKQELIKNGVRLLRDEQRKNNLMVIIPYANKLEPIFSAHEIRVRRDIDKLPDLIEIIALFNQYDRTKIKYNGQEFLIANYNDLRKAMEIAGSYFVQMSLNLDQTKKDILDFMDFKEESEVEEYNPDTNRKEFILKDVDKKYTIKTIHTEICRKKSQHLNTTRSKLEALFYDGYLDKSGGGKGKTIYYAKKKDYEKLDLDLEGIKEDVLEIIDLYEINWENKVKLLEEEEF
jgi:hypothetical protein